MIYASKERRRTETAFLILSSTIFNSSNLLYLDNSRADIFACKPNVKLFHILGSSSLYLNSPLVTRFKEEMFSFPFFFTAAHFHIALMAPSIPHFVTAATKFSCCSSTKKCLLCFLSLALDLCRPFILELRWLPPTFSFSLSFSCSIFQICGHNINLS